MDTIRTLLLGSLLAAGAASAQERPLPPPPSTSAAPTSRSAPDLSGTWVLDRDISDDLAQASLEPQTPAQGRTGGGMGGFGGRGGMGGFGGRGGMGGMGGGYGRGGGMGGNGGRDRDGERGHQDTPALTADEKARLQELTALFKAAAPKLVIAHQEPSVAVSDARGRTEYFETDGTITHHQLATSNIDSRSHWEGERLVTEYTLSDAHKVLSTYILLPATKQLVVRTRLDLAASGRAPARELKLVYSLSPDKHRP